jgi:hypothetical protein
MLADESLRCETVDDSAVTEVIAGEKRECTK